jgi:uncharacterized protein HemX
MGLAVTAIAVSVVGIGTNVVMAKEAQNAAKKAARKSRQQQLEDARAYAKEQRTANIRADNDALVAQAEQQLAQRNAINKQVGDNGEAGYAGQNAIDTVSPQIILPVAIGVTAVGLTVFVLARRKK